MIRAGGRGETQPRNLLPGLFTSAHDQLPRDHDSIQYPQPLHSQPHRLNPHVQQLFPPRARDLHARVPRAQQLSMADIFLHTFLRFLIIL